MGKNAGELPKKYLQNVQAHDDSPKARPQTNDLINRSGSIPDRRHQPRVE